MAITQYPRIPVPSNAVPDNFVYSSTSDQKYALGTILDLEDGRRFRYAEVGAVIAYKALMCQGPVAVANWETEVQTAKTAAVGDYDIPVLITTGSTFGANDWDEGWYIVESGLAGAIGDMYKIASHTVHDTAPTITIADPGGVRTALDANQVCSIIKSPYKDVVVVPIGAGSNRPIGVPLVDIPIGYFGWFQTRGPCPMIVDTGETIVAGDRIGEPAAGAVAGTCGVYEADATDVPYGYVLCVAAAAEAAIVDLTLE